jgi:outer membrane PBP1 activator LpoA protein
MALTETQWQQLVDYKQARIEALENRVKSLEALRDAALNDYDIILQAQNDTLDFINSKLNSNG